MGIVCTTVAELAPALPTQMIEMGSNSTPASSCA